LIMSPDRESSAVSLFGSNTDHFLIPAKVCVAPARNGGQELANNLIPGRPLGRRDSASRLTAAHTMSAVQSLRTAVCFVAILACTMSWNSEADAEQTTSATHLGNQLPLGSLAAFVLEASRRFAMPERWITAVMHAESGGKTQVRSRNGAVGLMQIMPATWIKLRARYGLGADPYDPHDNILAGAAYLHELHERYGSRGFLAAYNAGPQRYEDHLATGRPLPDETRAYVEKLARVIGGKPPVESTATLAKSAAWSEPQHFASRSAGVPRADRPSPGVRPNRPQHGRSAVGRSALVPVSGNLFVRPASRARAQ
jgi:hypothetical protein